MPACSVCLVTVSLSEAGPGRFGGQVSVTDIYHTIPYHTGCGLMFLGALNHMILTAGIVLFSVVQQCY